MDETSTDAWCQFSTAFELSQPVAVLLNEPVEVTDLAGRVGYRFFMEIEAFKHYVEAEILGLPGSPSD